LFKECQVEFVAPGCKVGGEKDDGYRNEANYGELIEGHYLSCGEGVDQATDKKDTNDAIADQITNKTSLPLKCPSVEPDELLDPPTKDLFSTEAASGEERKARSIREIAQEIDSKTKDLMEKQRVLLNSERRSGNKVDVSSKKMDDASNFDQKVGEVRNKVSLCEKKTRIVGKLEGNFSEAKKAIFFTSQDTRKLEERASSIVVIDSPKDDGRIARDEDEGPKADELSPFMDVHLARVPENIFKAGSSPTEAQLVKKDVKAVIEVEYSNSQHFMSPVLHKGPFFVQPKHEDPVDCVSFIPTRGNATAKNRFRHRIDRFSNKGNDIEVAMVRDIRYVEPWDETSEKRNRRGSLCNFFSRIFGCCLSESER